MCPIIATLKEQQEKKSMFDEIKKNMTTIFHQIENVNKRKS